MEVFCVKISQFYEMQYAAGALDENWYVVDSLRANSGTTAPSNERC